MTQNNDQAEQILLKYRPAAPLETLRDRALSLLQSPPVSRHSWGVWIFRAALAAVFIFACGLNLAADAMTRDISNSVGIGPAVWTEQAEEAAKLFGNLDRGRAYIALGLMSRPSFGRFGDQASTISGELQ